MAYCCRVIIENLQNQRKFNILAAEGVLLPNLSM
jgi:hypothetical protein